MMDKERTCKYSGCYYYDPRAETYCCLACSCDAYDHERLKREERKK